MFLSDFSIDRPVSATMIVLIIVVLGIAGLMRLPVDLLPDLTFPGVMIVTNYENASPEEIENSVTKLIEGAVSQVQGLKKLHSISQRGSSSIFAEFNWGENMDIVSQNIREKIDQIDEYFWPDEADDPVIMKFNPADIPIMVLSLAGGDKNVHQLQDIGEHFIKDRLLAVDGIASCEIYSGPLKKINVFIDQKALASRALTIVDIIHRLEAENRNESEGTLKRGYKDYTIRSIGEFKRVEEIGDLILTCNDNAPVYIKDVAQVIDGHGEELVLGRANLEPSATIILTKQRGLNTVRVAKNTWETIHDINSQLPSGVAIRKTFDQSEYINRSIGNVRSNLVFGGILAIIILFLFLHHVSPTLILALAIPISILATFIPMHFMGLTLNLMTLGGLAMAVGMLVDNSIVVLENVFRHLQEGEKSRISAAKIGAQEMASPIIAATLTTVAVFIPIGFITTNVATKIFKDLALTVSFSLIASLTIALILVPLAASRFLDAKKYSHEEHNLMVRLVTRLQQRFLTFAFDHKIMSLLYVFLFLGASLLLAIPIGKEFMPPSNDRTFMLRFDLPKGTRLEETDKVARKIEKIFLDMPEVVYVHAVVGSSEHNLSSEKGFMFINFKNDLIYSIATESLIDRARKKILKIPQIENIEYTNLQSHTTGGSQGKDIHIKIFGPDLLILKDLSGQIKSRMSTIRGIRDLQEALTFGNPEFNIFFDREKCARMGLSVSHISRILKASINGDVATRFRREDEEIDINVQLREDDRDSLEDIKNITIGIINNRIIRLSDLAELKQDVGPTEILRENQIRCASVTASKIGRDTGSIIDNIKEKVGEIPFPEGYFIEYGGAYEKMQETFSGLSLAFLLAVILVYMIMAGQFESFSHPAVIMFSIPAAVAGVLWTLLITSESISVSVVIGVIILAGIVVNNGIVMVEYINILRAKGIGKIAAIKKGSKTRIRPILITSLTTIFGLIPMALAKGEGAELRRPLAITIIGGLLFGILLTIFITPLIYSQIDEIGKKIKEFCC
ncbi:MAG: efflux RND transporter permease subunit [bacterium]